LNGPNANVSNLDVHIVIRLLLIPLLIPIDHSIPLPIPFLKQ